MNTTRTTKASAAKSTNGHAYASKATSTRDADDIGVEAMNRFTAAAEGLADTYVEVSWKRKAIAYVMALFVGAAAYSALVTGTMKLIVAAAAMTSSMFVAYLIGVIGGVIAFTVAVKIGEVTFNVIVRTNNQVLAEAKLRADQATQATVESVRGFGSKVASFFKRSDDEVIVVGAAR